MRMKRRRSGRSLLKKLKRRRKCLLSNPKNETEL
jgi:hypothetical protein